MTPDTRTGRTVRSARSLYPHVVSTLALVVALGTGGAYATGLAKNSVASKHIKDGAVRVGDLADGSVTTAKLAPGAVPNPLTDGAVTTPKLANGSVTAAKLAPGAVPQASIPDGAVTGPKLADGAVTGPKLADGAVTGPKLADGAVTGPKLGDNSVSGGKVADDSLTGADVNEGTLGTVPSATRSTTVLAAAVSANGTLHPGQSYNAVSSARTSQGQYSVTFNRTLTACSFVAQPGLASGASSGNFGWHLWPIVDPNNSSRLDVRSYSADGNNWNDTAFMVIVVC